MQGKLQRIELSFPHSWRAEILESRPLILPQRQFIYPRQAEEIERGALELLVTPSAEGAFLATCALGFNDPAVPSGIWSAPNPDWLCAIAGGYAYLINAQTPSEFVQIPYRPVLEVRAVVEQEILLFAGHHSLMAWGRSGVAWQSDRLSSEGVEILSIDGPLLKGKGWEMMTDRDVEFTLDLQSGQRVP